MTHEELMAIPVCGGYRTEVRELGDGKIQMVAISNPTFALFHEPDDPLLITDIDGRSWTVGWANGVRYRSEMT